VASRDLHLPHRVLDIPMGSWVAVEPSGKGLPSILDPEALDRGSALIEPRSQELWASSLPEVSPRPGLAEIVTSSSK
jgi:hypothetical protein